MSIDEIFSWIEKLAVFASVLQTFEMLAIRKAWSDQGIWRWSLLKLEFPKSAWLLGYVFRERNFSRLLHLRILVCAILLAFPTGFPFFGGLHIYLLLTTYLIAVRWRGAFNGGSDAMMIILLASITVGTLAPHLKFFCLVFIGVQTALSFFLAGVSKLRCQEWRRGRAVSALLTTSNFGVPRLHLRENMRFISWFIIAFECTFPIAYFHPVLGRIYLVTAVSFHLVNFFLFGLNRFFFTWISAYPVLFLSSSR